MPKVGMPEIRRPQLIRATMEVINQVGFLNASVARIGQQAGISPSIINHYFGSVCNMTWIFVLQLLYGV